MWDELFATQQTLAFNMKVEDKILFQRIFALGDEVQQENLTSAQTREKIKEVLQMHLKGDVKLALNK